MTAWIVDGYAARLISVIIKHQTVIRGYTRISNCRQYQLRFGYSFISRRFGIGILEILGLVVGKVDGNNAGLVLYVFFHFRPCDAFRGSKIFRLEVDFVIFVGQITLSVRFPDYKIIIFRRSFRIFKHAVGNRRHVKTIFLTVQLKNAVWAFNQTAGRSPRQRRQQYRVFARWCKVIILARNRHLNRAFRQIARQLA